MLCCFRASEETALHLSLDLSVWAQDFPVEKLQQQIQREAVGQGEVVHALGQEQGAAELE